MKIKISRGDGWVKRRLFCLIIQFQTIMKKLGFSLFVKINYPELTFLYNAGSNSVSDSSTGKDPTLDDRTSPPDYGTLRRGTVNSFPHKTSFDDITLNLFDL